jgi:hypothetical protein
MMPADSPRETSNTDGPVDPIPFFESRSPRHIRDTFLMDSRTPVFENDDWLIDDFGIRAKMPAGTFKIPASRLGELTTSSAGAFLFWPTHMAQESWARIDLFIEVYRQALTIHRGRYGSHIPDALLDSSINAAMAISAGKMRDTTKS